MELLWYLGLGNGSAAGAATVSECEALASIIMCIDCANVLALLRAIGHPHPKWFSAGGVSPSRTADRDRSSIKMHRME